MIFKHNHQVPPKNRSWMKLIAIIIPVVVIFFGAGLYAVNQWYEDNLVALSAGADAEDVIVVIETGSSVREIGDQLKDLGVIRNSTAFSWYVSRQDSAELQAGTYRLNPSQNVEEIVSIIASGDVDTSLFTILPGRRLDELAEDFIAFGFSPAETERALSKKYDHPLFDSAPANVTLEGYVYPETYEIDSNSSAEDVVERSFDLFNQRLTSELRSQLRAQDLTVHEAIILASVIERESTDDEIQPRIAQVFLNRLDQGIALGADATFYYAAAISGAAPSPDLDNPYNTRIYGGLPPGPIANFNFSAIQSIATPSGEDSLFFVSGDDGITYFSNTQAEHDALTNQHCNENCQIQTVN